MTSLIYNPPVPANFPIFSGFLPGCLVRVQGRINPAGQSFAVNIKTENSQDIGIHVNPRLQHGMVIRNSFISGKWGHEENASPVLPLRRGEPFEIILLAESGFTRIAINGQDFGTYTHRYMALNQLKILEIRGDITLQMVQIVLDPNAKTTGLAFPSPYWAYPLPFVGAQRSESCVVHPQPVEFGFSMGGKPQSPPPPYTHGEGRW